uniref:Uncharacterized protein n=2 Tax=Nyssomyia neivai TaxID=330878 RepID=A0A1L8D777_9DIPT
MIVVRRWAIVTHVRPSRAASSASCTIFSLSISRADVASSSRRIRGFRMRALAMATRCFCPPESCVPLSPRRVSYPSGSDEMKLWIFAFLAASIISCCSTLRVLSP